MSILIATHLLITHSTIFSCRHVSETNFVTKVRQKRTMEFVQTSKKAYLVWFDILHTTCEDMVKFIERYCIAHLPLQYMHNSDTHPTGVYNCRLCMTWNSVTMHAITMPCEVLQKSKKINKNKIFNNISNDWNKMWYTCLQHTVTWTKPLLISTCSYPHFVLL